MNLRSEVWNGFVIRFAEKSHGDWWAVAADVANALNYSQVTNMLRKVKPHQKGLHLMKTLGGEQEVSVISETGIYKVILRSRKKEAEDFEQWVFETIRAIRQATGLEAFQVFRMLDKDHQKEAMEKLRNSLQEPEAKVNYIKANTISNKAISNMFGHKKMVKKGDMTPDMLTKRQQILDETVNLMSVKERFGLDFKVSEAIYSKFQPHLEAVE